MVAEAVALLGVVGSLLLVAYEVRQNTVATRAEARQNMTANIAAHAMAMATSDVGDLWFRWGSGENISESELNRLRFAMIAAVRNLENVYLQVLEGVFDESALEGYGWRGSFMYGTEPFADWWRAGGRERFHPQFVAAFEAAYPILSLGQP
jgi:hypothetical protein